MVLLKNLRKNVCKSGEKISRLKGTTSLQPTTIANLLTKCDGNEQYRRRSCWRIKDIEMKKMWKKMRKCERFKYYKLVNVPFNSESIDHFHCIVSSYVDENKQSCT